MPPAPPQNRAAAFHRRVLDRTSTTDSAGGGTTVAVVPPDRAALDRAGAGEIRGGAPPATGGHDPGGGSRPVAAAPLGFNALAIALVGVSLGLAATALVVHRGWDPGAVAVGRWLVRPTVGTLNIDPYARAELAHSGAVPLAANEGLSFTATTDDTGYRLLRSCIYTLGGSLPAARFWTLTATDEAGHSLDDPLRRSAFASTEVVRDAAGAVAVEIGPEARPGNWLPLTGAGPLTLTLRLYDTPLADEPGGFTTASLPSIARRSCTARRAVAGEGEDTPR